MALYSHSSPFNDITVEDVGQLRTLRFGTQKQSSMYLDSPFETDFEYPNYFHLALALQPEAMRTLVIGLGGGTVVKRMWRDYPQMELAAVEIDPTIIDVAQRFFALPDDERIRVIADEGRHFLETTHEAFDIVVVDAFEGAFVPRPLTTEEFMQTAREHLNPGGVIVYNVMGSVEGPTSTPFRRLHHTLSSMWEHVWLFEVDEGVQAEDGNIIVLATDEAVHKHVVRSRISNRVGGRVSVPAFASFRADMYTGPVAHGDAPVITDFSADP